jgi:hypothetical protein
MSEFGIVIIAILTIVYFVGGFSWLMFVIAYYTIAISFGMILGRLMKDD